MSIERNKDLAAIHIKAKELGMGEFQRRALQFEVTGKESCIGMNAAERKAVRLELANESKKRQPQRWVTDEQAAEILGL